MQLPVGRHLSIVDSERRSRGRDRCPADVEVHDTALHEPPIPQMG